jgi:hypothetical protein
VQFICALLFAATLQVLANCTDLPSPRDLREPVFPQTVGFADCFVDSQTTLFEADVQRNKVAALCVCFSCALTKFAICFHCLGHSASRAFI